MIHLGQIEKNQYSLKREKFRNQNDGAYHSPNTYTIDISKNTNEKPLPNGIKTEVSFKGFQHLNLFQKTFKPAIVPIPQKLTRKVFDSLKNISSVQYEYYKNAVREYVDFIKIHTDEAKNATDILKRNAGAEYRKRNGISDEIAKKITEENLFYLPQKTIIANFSEQVIAPLRFIFNSFKKVVIPLNKEKQAQAQIEQKILKDFSALQGLIKSHEIWENGYRKISGNQKWTESKDFLIPDEVLYSKILRRRNKVVDPNKGKYSSTSMMLGNRFISGIIYSYFLGTDAYNTTMRYSNNEKEASVQRNSRIAQEFSRIGMNMYIQNLLFGTFEAAVNKSLATAMFVSGSTVAFSEVLGRKLVGKPIMPSDKETLDRLEKEMNEKKGILPAIGRLLTNVKKKDTTNTTVCVDRNSVSYKKTPANTNLYSSFTTKGKQKEKEPASNKPSFKGYYKVDNLVDKKTLTHLIKIIEKADEKTANNIKQVVIKSINKSKYFEGMQIKKPQSFEELLSQTDIEKVPVGQSKTVWGLWTSSIFVPLKFLKNVGLSLYSQSKKLVSYLSGIKNNELANELNMMKLQNDKRLESFQKYFESRKSLPAWRKSNLSEEEKEIRIFKEFKELLSKETEDIEGIKNILLWLDKQLKKENISINADGTLSESSVKRVRELLLDSVLRADSAKHVEYDGNTLAQTNINLSRAITTLFLMTDAYNLTMQYSNDNKKDANKSAKNRAAQEISRISVSAYILAFVHNLLSKLCNSSLGGAFTLTALTSTINDSISRKVVGVPLRPKTQEQLHEIDKQNAKSKSPIKKALAYSIGKKSALPKPVNSKKNNIDFNDLYYDGYFIKPEIN